ncbi:hypothetical protein ACR4XJ_05165 [Nitratidesulfovibrio sp. D1]|uniref:hypothetical protein n=1 Tax=Nitratidesulfovibrio sp. D1 TaxID=3440151 RepID=UPI003EBAC543
MATMSASGPASGSPSPAPRAPRGGSVRRGLARWALLVLACVLALALVLETGCTVRSRGQYDVSAGKTSRP